MQHNDFSLLEDLYTNHLATIEGIHFTTREIDVMACLFHARGTSKIASLLRLSPHTVITYIRNVISKLEGSSREGVIDFIEKSHASPFFKKYYAGLVLTEAFRESLEKVSKLIRKREPICLILEGYDQKKGKALSQYLEKYLKQGGLEAEVLYQEVAPKKDKKILLILANHEVLPNLPQEYAALDSFIFDESRSYYFSFFDILCKLFPDIELTPIITNFTKTYEVMGLPSQKESAKESPESLSSFLTSWEQKKSFISRRRSYAVLALLLFMLLCGVGLWMPLYQHGLASNSPPIRSDLNLPTETLLLNRPELITQLSEKFKTKEDGEIQTVALVGMGGVGKTTVARQYALTQKAPLIWQIKAETHESLKNSFENLAYALAKMEEDKKNLRSLQDIQDPKEKEDKILLFVKERMKNHPHWFLIYDNVESFSSLQDYFPQDPHSWGSGKIILTTRDMNIQNNTHVNHVISIGQMDPAQKLALFQNIMTHGNKDSFTASQKEAAKIFLERLPPFPLDITLAAYYLKATNVPYDKYLEHLNQWEGSFDNIQANVLKEAGDYTKTRYHIIALSLKQLMDINPEFGDLLLFISVLASHPIPRDLLDSYKNAVLVDDFIYNLKKYSLVTDQTPSSSPVGQTLSMHQCTQGIGLSYLTKALNLKKNKQLLQSISTTLKNYMADAIDKDDLDRMKLLITHCEWLLNHPQLLEEKEKESIGGELGGLYFYVKNYPKAQQVLEESLHKEASDLHAASIFIYLGLVYKDLAEYEKAKTLLEKSLVYYQQHDPKNHLRVAQIIGYLGSLEGDKGHYEVSRDLFEQSLALYKQDTTQAPLQRARVLTSLANVYREFAEYEKAKELLEESTLIYKKYYPENHVRTAWALALLGNVNRSLGQYDKAKDLLEESLAMYKKNYPDHHVSIAWISTHLGNTYRKLGQYDKAKELLEKSYFIYTNYFSDNHVAGAWVLTHLGNLYKELGDDVKAKEALEKGYRIYKAHNLGTLWSSAQLGNFYREQGQLEKARELINKSYATYQEHPAERDVRLAMLLRYLGNLSRDSGDSEKAKELLKTSQALYAEICGESHIETARDIHDLGKTYLLEGDLKEAGLLLQNALTAMEQIQHPDAYRVLETLADLESKKAALEESRGNTSQTQIHKAQAKAYLNKALDITKIHLPEESSHIRRIQSRI